MYKLTQTDIESITHEETLRGTTRFLPKEADIPLEFWGWFKGVERNVYFRTAEQMYTGDPPPMGDITFNPGFTGKNLKNFLKAHLVCIDAEYQHRMAGLAYMISTVLTIKEKV